MFNANIKQRPTAEQNFTSIILFLESRGIFLNSQDVGEISARMNGYESLNSLHEYKEREKHFSVRVLEPENVSSDIYFCNIENAASLLDCMDRDAAIRFADLECKESRRLLAVCDGNHSILHVANSAAAPISIHISLGQVNNPDAEFLYEIDAVDIDLFDASITNLSYAYLMANSSVEEIRSGEYARARGHLDAYYVFIAEDAPDGRKRIIKKIKV